MSSEDKIRIGLMGLGQVGRSLLRVLLDHPRVEVSAVVGQGDAETLLYLLEHDTLLGRFPVPVELVDNKLLVIDGRHTIAFHHGSDAGPADWAAHEAQIVIEATARPGVGRAQLEEHFDRGAQRVVLCVPPAEAPDRTVLMGVNHGDLTFSDRVVSNGSCTAHAAAPVLRLLDDRFGLQRVFLNTVHAYTNRQRLADVPAADPRQGRAASENIIPEASATDDLLVEVLPQLDGRIYSAAMNVPVPNGSCVELTCWHREPVTAEDLNATIEEAAGAETWRPYLGYETAPIVSSDVLRSPLSGLFDSEATMVMDGKVSKTLTWFDNGWGYVHRAVELVEELAALEES